jgi:hypothetical protein
VGATQYVQWVNESFAVFTKSTGAVAYGPAAGNTLWSGFGGACQTDNDGDPIAQYDKAAQRWVMTQFAVALGPPYYQCTAVSTTSDATGTFNRYSFSFSNFPDYPKLGVWTDAYYMSFNMFVGGTTFAGADACAFDRADMLTGAAAKPVQCFQQGTTVASLLPSGLDGSNPPPAGSRAYFVNIPNATTASSLGLWKFHTDWTTPANSTFTGPTTITVASFTQACQGGTCIPQSGTNTKLDSLADRLMYRLAYRNFGDHESLVVNHSVVAGATSGVRWYEIRSPGSVPTVYQSGTYAPSDGAWRWMGSVAMDAVGDMAVGYSKSSSTAFPSINYTGRLSTDPLGTLETEATLFAGAGSQTGHPALTRWGDYSAMSIDPVDDCTFWYTNEYLPVSGSFNWRTRIGNFKFPGCVGGPFVPLPPARILDTRNPTGQCTPSPCGLLSPHSITSVQITGSTDVNGNPSGVPSSGVAAVLLNVTVAQPSAAGFVTIYPAGLPTPFTSNVNFTPQQTIANMVQVPVGSGGQVSVYNDAGFTHLIFDVAGYFATAVNGSVGRYQPLVPQRVLDTRGAPYGPIGVCAGGCTTIPAGGTLTVQVAGQGGVPATGASAVVMNVTAVNTQANGFVTVFPTGTSPSTSTVNFVPGQQVPNRATVKLGTGGQVSIYNNGGSLDVAIDVNGYYSDGSIVLAGGLYHALTPARDLDTRYTPIPAGGTLKLEVAGVNGVPTMNAGPATPTAAVLNVTAADGTSPLTFITVYPSDASQPNASDLNPAQGQTVANLVIVKLAADGSITFFNDTGTVDAIVDVEGWYS